MGFRRRPLLCRRQGRRAIDVSIRVCARRAQLLLLADSRVRQSWRSRVLPSQTLILTSMERSMEYEHLARGLKHALLQDPTAFHAAQLATVTKDTVASWFAPFTPPQLDERVRKVRELGAGLARYFDGWALNVIRASNFSAVECLRLVLAHFPGFQDHTVYNGDQVFLYKRVQILVGDVWAAYGRSIVDVADPSTHVIGGFYDIDRLTMFADYRVPQVLRPEGVLQYSLALDALIQAKTPIPSGNLMEVEIRACTIQAVEQLHAVLTAKGHRIKVIELDWLLWQIGENAKDHLPNHHRTWSVFY
ncbi:hypothetical protein, variant 2 [Aphanomyces astaci]|uniref:Queuosine 5'-phosphate N-glycosylase/hydrolase n=1 Tax=Aphanomyces astaci TaxID=112090 RepID=W4G2C9_APHAT|nr:hypothetical protein, variant 1 [Aphanomyces astaci]XP_009837404.1 hypothetical protein, variant 2 [Aphanomyces astaci]ETV73198.1 hypothetical protein, variant 1 [Aphanomyces astaci]ETV73199.1 hypothetical protein, variant 2 [Aphanomyces astaci]|eukprot:XP_009837402.1 hypothetical protein, variant 1 [Aphanomyces astaci]